MFCSFLELLGTKEYKERRLQLESPEIIVNDFLGEANDSVM